MTAEFAAVVPAVVLVLACCLAGMQLAGQHIRLQDAAAGAARTLARGESLAEAAGLAGRLLPGTRLSQRGSGELVCVTASAPGAVAGGLIGSIPLAASSCALGGGK